MEQKTYYENSAHIPATPIKYIRYSLRGQGWWITGSLIAVFCAQLLSTSLPTFLRFIIDSAENVAHGGSVSSIWWWGGVFVVATALMFIAWRVSGIIGIELTTRANETSYTTLFRYLGGHGHTYFSNRFAGALASKVTHASEGVQALTEAFLWSYAPTVFSIIFTLFFIGNTNIVAALLFASLIGVLIPLNIVLAKLRRPHVVKYAAQATKARGLAVDTITNISAVRLFSRTRAEEYQFGNEISIMRALNVRQSRFSEWGLALNNFFIVLFDALIIFVSVKLWTTDRITIGELVMVLTLILNVQGSLVFIGNSMSGFIRRYSEIQEALTEILLPYEIKDAPGVGALIAPKGEIVFDSVAFGFEGNPVFHDFSLRIKGGERVGLVGVSGAGKTTLVSLILRQHDIDTGTIRIDGTDVREVTQESLRANIAVVPQEPILFHRSIRDNIAYGDMHATDEEVRIAARKAEAHEFIESLPEGYNTIVGERGVKLSGGQRQRIAIARALLKKANILILDEATSALDSESEAYIQKALQSLMKDKTVIAIAHRLSTLKEMDRIIVLDRGHIIEDGSHSDLLALNGRYAVLWKHQAGGFLQSK